MNTVQRMIPAATGYYRRMSAGNDNNEVAKPGSSHRFRHVRVALITAVLAVVVTLLWALFWQAENCSEPACVRQRFSLAIELDIFDRVQPIALSVETDDGAVSVNSVLSSGGIDVDVRTDQTNLPLAVASGKLDRADLYRFAQVWRSVQPKERADAQLYAMLAPSIVSDTGEDLFGVMFDSADREGFAVAPGEIAQRFQAREPESVPLMQLRTFIHELLHALNRRHAQAAQMPGGRLTIEAPTKCISSDMQRSNWSLREQPLMALSPSTILFFQSAPRAEVLPGKRNAPFLAGRASLADCRDVRATVVDDPTTSRWRFALKRIKSLLSFPLVQAASSTEPELEPADVELRVQAVAAAYPLGYPIAVRVTAINRGERALPLLGRLMPGYGMVRIETRRASETAWTTVQPDAWYEPIDDDEAMLAPGARTEQTVPIYYQKDHWTFPQAGTYQVRASLHLGDDIQGIVTQPVEIVIADPQSQRDREALSLLTDEEGRLREDLGQLLSLRRHAENDEQRATLERITTEYGETSLGSALQLSRAAQLLRQPIDPRTGERPPPDLAGARELLADSCTDSGVAAMRLQLLDFQKDVTGAQPAPALVDPVEAAWDGMVPRRTAPLETYADPALSVAEHAFHFCHDESHLRGKPAVAVRRFARELRRAQPERVVIVGHADHEGTCSYNNALAMRRAEAVRAVLIDAGIRRNRIQIASLGERRPLDFSTGDAANARNRRVEILLPSQVKAKLTPPKDAAEAHSIPSCRPETPSAQPIGG